MRLSGFTDFTINFLQPRRQCARQLSRLLPGLIAQPRFFLDKPPLPRIKTIFDSLPYPRSLSIQLLNAGGHLLGAQLQLGINLLDQSCPPKKNIGGTFDLLRAVAFDLRKLLLFLRQGRLIIRVAIS